MRLGHRTSIIVALIATTFLVRPGTVPLASQESVDGFSVAEHRVARVADWLQEQRNELDLPGLAAAIVHDGEVVMRLTIGDADETHRPVLPATPFMLASVSKSITALAVMQLIDDGVVSLDDPITDHIPEFALADPAVAEALTVRDFVYHRSGLDRTVGADPISGDDGATLEANVARLAGVAPEEPGVFRYSNVNYDVLALLVERVSGTTFAEYLRTRVFEPLDMRHSYVRPDRARAGGLAQGYYHWLGLGYRPFDPPFPDGLSGSATMFSSLEDLTHLLLAHLGEGEYRGARILSRQGALALRAPYAAGGTGYAMGWFRVPVLPSQLAGRAGVADVDLLIHDGDWTAYRSYLWMVPDLELGGLLLVNGADVTAESLLDQVNLGIRAILFDLPPPEIRHRDEFLLRWGKHLMLTLAMAQVMTGAYAAAAIARRFRTGRVHHWGRTAITAAAALDVVGLVLIVRVIPATAEAPLGTVMAAAPDYRILIIATGGVAALGGLRLLGLLAALVRGFTDRTPRVSGS